MEMTIILHTGETFTEKVSRDVEKLTYSDILSAFGKTPEEWVFVKNGRLVGNVLDTVFDDNSTQTPLRTYVVDFSDPHRRQPETHVQGVLSGIFGGSIAGNQLPQPTPHATTQPRYLDIIRTMIGEASQVSDSTVLSDNTYASSIATLREMGFTHSEPVMRRYIRLYGGDIEMIANFFLNMTTHV